MSEVRRVVRDGLWDNNVVFAQMLGMCPTLATTGSATNGLGIGPGHHGRAGVLGRAGLGVSQRDRARGADRDLRAVDVHRGDPGLH